MSGEDESRESRVESAGPKQSEVRSGALDRRLRLLCLLTVLLMVGLRIVALRSDPYNRLDWSGGQLTDEGFYIHNARNVALFGHARTDEFNNMLLAPLLHYLQVVVFAVVGVGSVQARLISVVCSLITLCLLWAALRRAFDQRIALTAVLFLGLDHTNLLFNRMALMDTPAMMTATAAFYAFVRGVGLAGEVQSAKCKAHSAKWMGLCGLLLGVTVTNRMLCAYLLPVPFLALWAVRRRNEAVGATEHRAQKTEPRPSGHGPWSMVLALSVGLVLVLATYTLFWYLPHRNEIAPMSAYYRSHQIQPRSLASVGANIYHAVLGDFRGIAPYLFRHTPIIFVLAILGLMRSLGRREAGPPTHPSTHAPTRYLSAWLLLGWLLLAVISYSPSRYYVTTYPALAALAAIGLWDLPETLRRLSSPAIGARVARAALAWFVVYHMVEAAVHRRGVLPFAVASALLYGLPSLAALAAWGCRCKAEDRPIQISAPRLAVTGITAWFLVNAAWLGDWLAKLDYSQYNTSRWLARTLPPDTIMIGDVTPGLCLDNDFVAVHVQIGLCNWRNPMERFAGHPRVIATLDGRWRWFYWDKYYPGLATEPHRLSYRRVLRWDIGIYSVDFPVERLNKNG